MLDLFGNSLPGHGSLKVPREFQYLKRSLVKEVDVVKRHYRLNSKPFPNSHPLMRLIDMLPLCWTADDYQYSNIISDMHTDITRILGFTDYQNKGSIFPKGFFLGPDTREAVLCVNEPSLYLNMDRDWYMIQPMRYVYHTRTDVNVPFLNNKLKGVGFGLLTLDVSLLMVKYRHWVKYQKRKSESIPTAAAFITSFVIPDLLESYMNIAIFNRMDQNLASLPLRSYPSSHPFYLTNYTVKIDEYNTTLLNFYKGLKTNAGSILDSVPLFFSDNLLSLLQKPQTVVNRNNEWFYVMQRIPFYRFILRLIQKGYVSDSLFINKFTVKMRQMKNDGSFRQAPDPKFTEYFLAMFNDVAV